MNKMSEWLSKLRKGKSELETQTNELKETEDKTQLNLEETRGWTVYDSGAFGTHGYFKDTPLMSFQNLMSFEEVRAKIRSLKEAGKKTMTLDVMGQGRVGHDLGADVSVGWTYKEHGEEKLEGRVIETGDLFDEKIVQGFIKNLKDRVDDGLILTDVFLRSEGGLGIYLDNPYALAHIYENVFGPVYELAPEGTRFFLGMRYAHDTPRALMEALRNEGYDIRDDEHGYYLLTKSATKPTLPSLRTLSSKYDFENKIKNT